MLNNFMLELMSKHKVHTLICCLMLLTLFVLTVTLFLYIVQDIRYFEEVFAKTWFNTVNESLYFAHFRPDSDLFTWFSLWCSKHNFKIKVCHHVTSQKSLLIWYLIQNNEGSEQSWSNSSSIFVVLVFELGVSHFSYS